MSHPSKTLKETEEALGLVIKTLIDSQEGFVKIGDEIKDETLKTFFLAESLKRAEFRGDLEEILHQEGVHDIKESGSVTGAIHRTWGELKTKLGGGDPSLLESAEQGEHAARSVYEDALNRELPFPIRQTLTDQLTHVLAAHDYIKSARLTTK